MLHDDDFLNIYTCITKLFDIVSKVLTFCSVHGVLEFDIYRHIGSRILVLKKMSEYENIE
jgi:hypothetical protein